MYKSGSAPTWTGGNPANLGMSAHLYSSGGHQHTQVWKKSFSPFRIAIRVVIRDRGHSALSSVFLMPRTLLIMFTNAIRLSCVNGALACVCCTVVLKRHTITMPISSRLLPDLHQRLPWALRIILWCSNSLECTF